MDTEIKCEVDGHVATITLDGPAKLNAITQNGIDDLLEALDEVDRNDAVRAVVVTGAGRAFCAGTDLTNGFALPTGGDPVTGEGVPADLGAKVVLRIFRMNKPVIGAINGPAVGFGASVTLPMDVRICSTQARFGYVFVRRAIVAESCSSWFLPRIVGIANAVEWMMTGRMIGADEALAKGLVHEVVSPEELMARALRKAKEIAADGAPVSVAMTRRLLWRMLGASHPIVAHRYESRALVAALALPDVAEAMASYKEKRRPGFNASISAHDLASEWWPSDDTPL
ncbi:MAG: enoyl-CoA hydratase [Hyphomicrobiales bacterium]|nr:MAG: enoyl-CoA hydratase [Hyphomicrobiales bacterium]